MEQVGDLVGSSRAGDERADGVGDDPARRRCRARPSEPGVSPTMSSAPHGSRPPGMATASSGRPSGRIAGTCRPARRAGSPAAGRDPPRSAGRGISSVLPRTPKRAGTSTSRNGSGDVRAGHGTRHEAVAARLPDRDEVVAVCVADGPDGRLERLVRIVEPVDRPDDGRGDRQVEMVTLGVERVGAVEVRRTLARHSANRAAAAGSTVRRPPQVPAGPRGRRRPHRSRPPRGTAGGHPAGSDGRRAD